MKTRNARLLIVFTALLQMTAYGQQNGVAIDQGKNLPTAVGKQRKLPYSKMATSAKFIGTALADPDWFNWCISPIWGKDRKFIFSAAGGRQQMVWKAGLVRTQRSHILLVTNQRGRLRLLALL